MLLENLWEQTVVKIRVLIEILKKLDACFGQILCYYWADLDVRSQILKQMYFCTISAADIMQLGTPLSSDSQKKKYLLDVF